jgi:melatonin receptor type 1B
VLYVFYRSPDLRSVTNYHLITLAVSDIAYPMITLPPVIATAATGRDMFGNTAGQVIGFLGLSFAFGPILTAFLIAKNRFFCVVKPII